MCRLIVHIGQPKTGTTTLQEALLQSRDALLEQGILYPQPMLGNNHTTTVAHLGGIDVATALDKIRHPNDPARILSDSAAAWTQITDDIAAHPANTIILSSESFSDLVRYGDVTSFIAALKALSDDITFVAYLRAPAAYYLSLKQQDVRHIGVIDPPHVGPWYKPMLAPLMALSGIKVDAHVFDRAHLIGNDIRADFAHRYLPENARNLLNPTFDDLNQSISAEGIAVLEDMWTEKTPPKYRRMGPPTFELSQLVLKLDRKLPGLRKPMFKPGVAHVIDNAPTDLDWLQSHFGIVFEGAPKDIAAQGVEPPNLTDIRSLCEVDEERYNRLWADIAKARRTRLRKILRKIWRAQRYIARGRKRVIRAVKDVLRLS